MQLDARLRAFAAVARQGSFSRAAAEIYVSQPAVSKHVAALEAELGTRLVERSRAGATLTATGAQLADYVLRAEALLANASRALAAAAGETAGTVKVVASGVPGDYVLPTLLPAFREQHPRVHVDLEVTTSRRALELVRSHEAELAVVGGFGAPPELEFEAILEDEIVLVGPPDLASRRLRPADLERLVWVEREEGSSTRAAVEAARWQLGVQAVETVELRSWEAVKKMVLAGGGIAAISRLAVEHELAAGALAVLDVPRWTVLRTLSIATARDVPLTPAASHFREALRGLSDASQASPADEAKDLQALERLAVFVDGFAADAAAYVCDVGPATLARLAERGLVERDGRRFGLQSARRDGVEADLARRHAEFFASLVDESEPRLTHLGQDEWTSRLLDEQRNIDAAVRWAAAHGERALQLRLLGRSWQLWLGGEYAGRWSALLQEALADVDEPRLRNLALAPLSWSAYSERDFERAETLGRERFELARAAGDTINVAGALSLLAALAEERGDFAASRALHEEAVDVDRRAGDDVNLMRHLYNLAVLLVDTGDFDPAEAALHEAAAIARGRGDDRTHEDIAELLAWVALGRGLPERALELAQDSFKLRAELRPEYYWGTLDLAGAAAVGVGRAEVGARLLAAAERLRQVSGADRTKTAATARDDALAAATTALGDAALARETRRGEKLTLEQALELARETTPAPRAARRSSAPAASRSSSSRARRARR